MNIQDNQIAGVQQEIVVGMIVKIKDPQNSDEQGHYRVRKVTKNTINLGSVFGKRLYFKGNYFKFLHNRIIFFF